MQHDVLYVNDIYLNYILYLLLKIVIIPMRYIQLQKHIICIVLILH